MAASEPFPVLNTSAEQLYAIQNAESTTTHRRRKSSVLGHDIRVGDTGTPALATSLAHAHGVQHVKESKDASSKRFSKRRKARSLIRRAKHFAIKHTWVVPLLLLFAFLSLYAVNPTESNPIHHFFYLSYKLPTSSPDEVAQYGKGLWDIAFVCFYTVVLSFWRELIMQEVLRPITVALGIKSRAKQARFMEQLYAALYHGTIGIVGMWVMSRTPVWYFNTKGMYEGFPHRQHDGPFKFYYLFQAAYWAQLAIVLLLGLEKPRKDYYELVGHHIVTLALIGLSYRFHFTYMGIAVYITHDISDFFLATSKAFNYLDVWFVPHYFFLFSAVWTYMRHYLNLRIIWSLFNEFQTVGPYELDWATEQYKCWISNVITGALLSALQALNIFWMYCILRIAYRMVVLDIVEDDRSEAEESAAEDEPQQQLLAEQQKSLLNGNGNSNGKAKTKAAKASR